MVKKFLHKVVAKITRKSNKQPIPVSLPPSPPPTGLKKAIVFFIGGAGDKKSYYGSGPHGNLVGAKNAFQNWLQNAPALNTAIEVHYLGYNEVYGAKNIKKYVLHQITSTDDLIFMVGHSLGAWNAAHLTAELHAKGYTTTMLVTLDPVGRRGGVQTISNIPYFPKSAKANFWVNVFVNGGTYDFTDFVADSGGRWYPHHPTPQVNVGIEANHYQAEKLFTTPIQDGKSALDWMALSLRECLED